MQGFPQALRAWCEAIGEENVVLDQDELNAASTATFATSQRASALLRPADTQEVQKIVRIANQYKVPIYPISKGKNWGLGSRVPTADGCALVELGRLNRIRDFNEGLSYLTIEAGVTFRTAVSFLKKENSDLFLSVIGGPPDSSVVANILERGEGLGPLGDHATFACGLEVVLPNAEIIHTGFAGFPADITAKIHRWGVGPWLDGLFMQSNLGIVTKATVWLKRKPRCFQAFAFTLEKGCRFDEVVSSLRELQSQGVIESCSLGLWNTYKVLMSQRQFPWEEMKEPSTDLSAVLKHMPSMWHKVAWFGFGALYAADKTIGRAQKRLLKKALYGKCEKLILVDHRKAYLGTRLHKPLRALTGMDVKHMLQSLYSQSVYLGNPIETSLKGAYWRKKSAPTEQMNPDRDRCGLIWLCHVVPFEGSQITKASQLIESICASYRFEPNIALLNLSERCLHLFAVIVYDRDTPGEDSRALECHDRLFAELTDSGFCSYRLGIQSMRSYRSSEAQYLNLLHSLKEMIDPNDILAPGRYDFRTK